MDRCGRGGGVWARVCCGWRAKPRTAIPGKVIDWVLAPAWPLQTALASPCLRCPCLRTTRIPCLQLPWYPPLIFLVPFVQGLAMPGPPGLVSRLGVHRGDAQHHHIVQAHLQQ